MERKQIRVNPDYFVCMSVDILSKLMQRGFFPTCTKKSCRYENTWLWYFDTTDRLLPVLEELFPDRDIVVVD